MQHQLDKTQQRTLVLLPGLDGTGRLFQPFIASLPRDIPTQAVIYPPAKCLTLDEHAQWAASWFPQGRIVILAESFSGLVALSLLISRVRPIEAVVFCASFAEPPRPWLRWLARLVPQTGLFMRMAPPFFQRQFCIGPRANQEQLSLLRAALSEVSPDVLTHRLRIVATEHSSPNTRFIVPCYYLQAKNDRLVPSRAARWFEDHFASFRLEKVEGPHFMLQANPQECAQRVVNIWEETATKRR